MIETIEWVACSERLPTAQETVLFCAVDSDGGDRYILQGWHEGGEWYGVDDPKPFPSALYWAAWPAGPRPDLLTISETAERLRVSARTVTDAQQALAQVREALANEALFDPGASTADTYSACKAFGTACTPENMRAILAHVEAQKAEIERLTAERDEARAERDALRIELDVCRSAIEDCYDIVETFDCYNDSDDACQRATLRRLNEAIGKAAPRLLHERPEGQKLYGLRYRELMAERDALHAVATDAHRDIDELRRQLAEAELDAQRYRWLRGDSCPDHSVRWTQWEVQCWRAPQWTADLRRSALDVAIDAAMRAGNE